MYDKTKLFRKAKKAIKNENLVFFYEIPIMIGISRSCFYDHFPTDCDEYDELENLLMANRSIEKRWIRQELKNSGNPHALLKLYRLLSEPQELALLNGDIERVLATQPKENESQIDRIRRIISPNPKHVKELFDGKIDVRFVNMDEI